MIASAYTYALLESLGLDADSCGEIPLAELRRRLTDPVIHRRLGDDPHLSRYLPSLVAMARSTGVPVEACLAWA